MAIGAKTAAATSHSLFMSEPEAMAALLREGVRLFNDAEYLEAHEVLEELWESGFGESADFYKGLLQASIALHHFRRGNLDGARKLYRGHRRYLATYLPNHQGIAVAEFLEDMQAFLQPVIRAAADASIPFEPASRPRMKFQTIE